MFLVLLEDFEGSEQCGIIEGIRLPSNYLINCQG